MNTIWKFVLEHAEHQGISMSAGAKLLSIQCQREKAVLWVLRDPARPLVTRHIHIVSTGGEMGDSTWVYIATVLVAGEDWVWHFFDGGETF